METNNKNLFQGSFTLDISENIQGEAAANDEAFISHSSNLDLHDYSNNAPANKEVFETGNSRPTRKSYYEKTPANDENYGTPKKELDFIDIEALEPKKAHSPSWEFLHTAAYTKEQIQIALKQVTEYSQKHDKKYFLAVAKRLLKVDFSKTETWEEFPKIFKNDVFKDDYQLSFPQLLKEMQAKIIRGGSINLPKHKAGEIFTPEKGYTLEDGYKIFETMLDIRKKIKKGEYISKTEIDIATHKMDLRHWKGSKIKEKTRIDIGTKLMDFREAEAGNTYFTGSHGNLENMHLPSKKEYPQTKKECLLAAIEQNKQSQRESGLKAKEKKKNLSPLNKEKSEKNEFIEEEISLSFFIKQLLKSGFKLSWKILLPTAKALGITLVGTYELIRHLKNGQFPKKIYNRW